MIPLPVPLAIVDTVAPTNCSVPVIVIIVAPDADAVAATTAIAGKSLGGQ